ncbi:MAG TPA: hypothetical protein VEL76_23430 [Gemmataceae bacterium]|nr:hypothetical protein [Gemmataceae bacterium]
MKPVWIKYYGLIPMTRFGYLTTLAAVAGFAFVAVLAAAVLGTMPPLDTMWSRQHHLPGPGIGVWFYNYMYWFILACLVAQVIDTWTTLHTFAKKEAAQRAQLEKEWERLDEGEGYQPPDEHIRPR